MKMETDSLSPIVVIKQKELELAERDEERRILTELADEVGFNALLIKRTLDTVAQLDLAFAKAKFAEDLEATEPVLQVIQGRRNSRHPGSIQGGE